MYHFEIYIFSASICRFFKLIRKQVNRNFIKMLCCLFLIASTLHASTSKSVRQTLNGVHLNFGVYNVSCLFILVVEYSTSYSLLHFDWKIPPYNVITLKPDGNYTHTGSTPLLIEWLTERINFTYVYRNHNFILPSCLLY